MNLSHAKTQSLEPGWAGLRRDDLPDMADTPEQSRYDFRTLWPDEQRDRPLELEIGSGKGTFLVQQAEQLTDVNYLGIEFAHAFWRYAADRIRRRNLTNARCLHADAKTIVGWYCPDAIFRQVHIYFPDPWPKKRHHKRRMIQAPLLRQLHRVLKPEGLVRIVTDHDDYFQWMEDHVAQVTDIFDREPFERPVSADEGEVVGTNFERKYRREGRPFHGMTLRRK